MSARYTSTRIPQARPLGGPSVMAGTYDGAELQRAPVRPGAQDALAIPSLIAGRRVTREEQRETLRSEAPAAPTSTNFVYTSGRVDFLQAEEGQRFWPVAQGKEEHSATPAPAPALGAKPRRDRAYHPREGSVPHRVIAHLRERGGYLPYAELIERFGVPQESVIQTFTLAVRAGALQRLRLQVGNKRIVAIALPDYVHRPASSSLPQGQTSDEFPEAPPQFAALADRARSQRSAAAREFLVALDDYTLVASRLQQSARQFATTFITPEHHHVAD